MEAFKFFKYLKEKSDKDFPLIVNVYLYYKDKTLIDNEEHIKILDKAYEWLNNLLTDDLDNLETFEPKNKRYYDVLYKDSEDNIILGYNKKSRTNDIDYNNFYLKFKSYMSDYIKDYKTLIEIIHEYLMNTLKMEGDRTDDIIVK